MSFMRKLFLAALFALSLPVFAAGIDINTATAEDLAAIQGIGPAKAAAIVAYREANGPFSSLDQVTAVKGIGPKLLAKMKPALAPLPAK